MTQTNVNQLVINKLESLEIYEALKSKGLSDEEIYLLTPEGIKKALEDIKVPPLSKGTDSKTTTTVTPTNKVIKFTAMTDTSVKDQTITDKNTEFSLDLSGFALSTDLAKFSGAMVFKGSLGTNGTITSLPQPSSDLIGHTYKVITSATYNGIPAEVGDVFTCSDKPEWVLIPSGDEPIAVISPDYVSVVKEISISGGEATTATLSATASGAAVGANGTANVITGYPNANKISAVTNLMPTTNVAVRSVSNTTAKALTGLGNATTASAITGYASPSNANFINSVSNTTTNVINKVSTTNTKALTGLGTPSTSAAVTGYASPANASFINSVSNTTTNVVGSVNATTVSVVNGVLTIPSSVLTSFAAATVVNNVSTTNTKALTSLGTPSTTNFVTGYASPTTANFINSVSTNNASVVNSVSSTNTKALTGLGTPSTTNFVTGYASPTSADFVNSVTGSTYNLISGFTYTDVPVVASLGTPSTANVLTGVKITAQPTITVKAGNGTSVVTGVTGINVTKNSTNVLGPNTTWISAPVAEELFFGE